MKKLAFILLSILMASTVSAQGYEPKAITLTDAERTLVEQNSDFAFNLFRKTRGTGNHVISPLSITYALGMLNNGAEGVTRDEICQVLSGGRQEGYADVATMNAFCRKMLTKSALLDEDTRVAIANTIYFNRDRSELSLKSAFKDAAATYYDATPTILSFGDPATLDAINQWATDHTDGMIHDLLKPGDLSDPNLVSLLLNAICFKGAWTNQFEEARTVNAYFDQMTRTAMMMEQTNEFLYANTDLYQSVILPYGNGAYQMTLFLPHWGKTIDDVLAAMNGTNWNTANYEEYMTRLEMPRIETDTDQDLVDIMASLGMPNAFQDYNGHGFLDFCYFGDDESNSDCCQISMMKQKAHLRLDEKGTEAAAATVVALTDKAALRYTEFVADRPFLYIISERSTGSIFFIGQYVGEPLENPRHDISLTQEERQLVKSNNDFALRLFREARGEKNNVVSPLSITYALGMLNNGAASQTQREINDVLGFGEAGADAINQFCRKMLTECGTLDKETKANIANTIYVNKHWGYELKETFVEKANEYYDAQPESRDFYDGATRDVINQWGSDHTEGMIEETLSEEEFNEDAVSYLLNAIYFKGAWTMKFDSDNTGEEPFNGGAAVPMMHIPCDKLLLAGTEFEYTDNDLYQAIRLPYGNEAFQMTVILPQEDKTLGQVLEQMDGQDWQFNGHSTIVDLKLPRFETEASIDLKSIMSALGMPSAFIPGVAEFPEFCNAPTYINKMKQAAKIKVDEEGTEAAAITVIESVSWGMPSIADFHANRPFLYIISEKSTGVIFFIGQYVGDTTVGIQPVGNGTKDVGATPVYDLQGRKVSTGQPTSLKKGIYVVGGKKVVVR